MQSVFRVNPTFQTPETSTKIIIGIKVIRVLIS